MLVNEGSVRVGPVSFQRTGSGRKLSPIIEQVIPGSRFKRPIPVPPYCSTTYVSIAATCPSTCRFKGAGCYVQVGITGARARALDDAAASLGMSGDDVTRAEAILIDKQWPSGVPQDGARGGRDLRLHVGGDVASADGALVLAAAAQRWMARGGGAVFTYTHRWAEIPRSAWNPINVLASVETLSEADEAASLGYMPSFTMQWFPSERAWRPRQSKTELKVVPCPAQTRKKTCVQCRLCMSHQPGMAIGFAMHGIKAQRSKRQLPIMWEHIDERMDFAGRSMVDLKGDLAKQLKEADDLLLEMGVAKCT